jgi:hypothetical protein
MQLWQFLYALLSDPQHKDLIEWTDNVKEREFRLHEPEAVAISDNTGQCPEAPDGEHKNPDDVCLLRAPTSIPTKWPPTKSAG